MDVWNCIVPTTRHSNRVPSPLVRLVEGEEKWEAPNNPQDVLSHNWGGTKRQIVQSPVWCLRLRLTRGEFLNPCRNEFRGPSSGIIRTGGISNNSNILEGSELTNRVTNDAKMDSNDAKMDANDAKMVTKVAKVVAKNDANLSRPP
ncbi:hypothetical protein TNCV_3630771 [Trichonephila clavipes]|nr:hypothetical protein TNCV_3630771 [Trichonephila clavipes]